MALETNLNVSPYFDDFSEGKNFHRVLFRPGYAVQARELTQIQSILQNQIERFANKVVYDGKIISGVSPQASPVSYVKLRDKDAANNRVVLLGDFFSGDAVANLTVTGETSGMVAQLIDAKEGSEAAAPNYLSIFVDYQNSGTDNSTKTFADNEQLIFKWAANNSFKVAANTISANATGYGLRGTVSDGIIYHKGNFVRVDSQGIILEKYNTTPTKKMGFETKEILIDSNQDSSLLDNATGSTNYSAPGANRLKLTPTLAVRDRDAANTTTFFSIAYIEEGSTTLKVNDELAGVNKLVADRIFETNGNYATQPFNIRIREHIKRGDNLGRYANGDIDKLVAEVEPGVGYINGNRIELLDTVYRSFDKATDTSSKDDSIFTQTIGNYVVCDEVCGSWDMKNLDEVKLYDTAQNAITDGNFSGKTVSGSEIGTARIRGFEYNSGNPGLSTGQFRIYLYDIQMGSNKNFKNVKSLYVPDSGGSNTHSFADPVLESGNAVLKEPSLNSLVFPFSHRGTKIYQSDTDPSSDALYDTQFVYRTEIDATVTSQNVSITVGSGHTGGSEALNETGAISDTLESEFIVVSTQATTTSDKTGTITVSGTGVTGSGTSFSSEYAEGDFVSYGSYTGRISNITGNTNMTFDSSPGNAAGVTHARTYKKGHIFDFTGSFRNLSSTGGSPDDTIQLDFGETFGSSFSIKVYANVLRSNAVKASKDVQKDKYVHINTSTHGSGANGPWSLGVCDAYSIVAVYKGGNTSVTTSDSDVTSHFELVTGQKDGFYDTSFLKQKSTSSLDLSDSGILVKFNYFKRNVTHGHGYFSADSYPVNDSDLSDLGAITTSEIPVFTSPVTGSRYDLRDCIDFRPMKTNTVTPSGTGTVASAPTNPGELTSYDIQTQSFMIAPDENTQTGIEFYLPRKDRIIMTSEGEVEIVKGISSLSPRTPDEKSGSMTLAELLIPPYPSLSPYSAFKSTRREYGVSLSVTNNRRFTMKDLRSVEHRVKKLEYYSSLNALESSAKNKQLFGTGGLDRFKNGFFVDNFDGHNIADTSKKGYRAAIDRNRTQLRPTFNRYDVGMDYSTTITPSNMVKKGNMVLLSHTETPVIDQKFASKKRNPVQEMTFNWRGEVILNPSMDNIPDITTLPDIQVDFDGMYAAMAEIADKAGITGTDWGGWNTTNVSSETENVGRWTGWESAGITEMTTTQTEQIRNGIQTTVSPSNETFEIGNFVENVAVRDYMRSRIVQFNGTRMKPNTKVYPYFDDESVSDYCTPTNSSYANTSTEGSALTTDANGNVYGVFRIPNDDNLKFRIGTRRFKLLDIADTDTEADLLTTSAHGDYTSIGLDIQQRGSSINLVTPQISTQSVTNNRTLTSTTTRRIATAWWDNGDGDPLSQTFTVSEPKSDGVFITKIDLFFAKKSSNLPVSVQIREVENGYPTSVIVPHGSVTVQSDDVVVDGTDGSEPTTFTFETPIYLRNRTDYAIVVKPAGNSTDYALWVSELGGKDVITGELIHKQPSTGIMFTSANDKAWDPIQSEDLKFKMYKAVFTKDPATVYLENDDTDYITFKNATGTFNPGEKVSSGSNHGFVKFYDPAYEKLYLERSSGGFSVDDVLLGSVSSANCTIASIDNLPMNTVVPKVPTMIFANTSIQWEARTTHSGVIRPITEFAAIDISEENSFIDNEKQIYSKSNSGGLTSVDGSQKTFVMKGSASTTDVNVSPVFDASRLNAITLNNVVNNTANNEWKEVGDSYVRYITKPVELAEGNDAEDLKVFLTAYKPQTTDIKVYARIHNPEDAEGIDEKDFTPLDQITSSTTYSDSVNNSDFIEFEYGFSANTDGQGFLTSANSHARLNTDDNEIVYYKSGDGSIHSTYNTFAIKIVMTSSGSNLIPLVKDMRAIALQK